MGDDTHLPERNPEPECCEVKMSGIRLKNESDYRRTIEIEAELIEETGYRSPPRSSYITYPAEELIEAIKARLNEEGINYEVQKPG